MVQSAYNPQEVLSPLMQRFGRHLHGERVECLNRMVSVVSEALDVDATYARSLVRALVSAGLIDFEREDVSDEFARTDADEMPSVARGEAADPEHVPVGAWRIGPET